jgi:hypothetical protein
VRELVEGFVLERAAEGVAALAFEEGGERVPRRHEDAAGVRDFIFREPGVVVALLKEVDLELDAGVLGGEVLEPA